MRTRKKRFEQNPEKCREQEAKKMKNSHQKGKSDDKKALIRFKNATRHGPIFVCSCCYTRQFQENTLKLNKAKNKIKPEIYQKCIPDGQEVTVKTCVNNRLLHPQHLDGIWIGLD